MAEELDPSMLPNWLRDMDDGPSVRPGADDGARYGLTWCGSFTVHGLGFQAMNGTTTDFAMAWPIGNGAWQVLQDAYDIYDPVAGQDGYIETDDLNDIMRENGFRSLNSFTAAEGEGWRESLTRVVAARWCRERYSVPLTFIDGPSSLSRLVSCATAFDPYSDRALVAPGKRLQHGRLRQRTRAQGRAASLHRGRSRQVSWTWNGNVGNRRPASPTRPESKRPRAQVRASTIERSDCNV